MALNNFIPQVWSARLLERLYKAHVYGSALVANTDYEGEIRQAGDTVKINSIGDVTIKSYTRNSDIDSPEELSDAQQMLLIDQQKYFNFAIDDVDRAQTKPDVMDAAMRSAGDGLIDAADRFIAAKYTEVPSANLIGSDGSPTSISTAAAAYEYLVDLGVLLSESSVPKTDRFVVVPPWFYGRLQKDDRFVKAGTATTDAVLRNGVIGQAAGFTVMESNNVPETSGTKYKIIAGHKMALSFAEQIVKLEAFRPERRFSDAMKGLHVYGAKLVRPYAWAVLTANKS